MKTVLEELEEDIYKLKESKCYLNPNNFASDVIDLINYYKEKEKNNLIDFHIEVMKIGLINEGEKKWTDSYAPKIKEVATKYYYDTYKTVSK